MKKILTIIVLIICFCAESKAIRVTGSNVFCNLSDLVGTKWKEEKLYPSDDITTIWEFTSTCIQITSFFPNIGTSYNERPYYLHLGTTRPKTFDRSKLGKSSQFGNTIVYLIQQSSRHEIAKIESLTGDSLILKCQVSQPVIGSNDPYLLKFKRIKDGESSPEGTNNNSEGTKNNDEKDDNKNYYIVPLN